jgi:TetR/AcrR family transcriptional regulator, transcriptional repressor for nem operon
MARPRQFDADEVRERIADAFTANGYRGTSLAMLCDAAGMGKQSLYNAFGDKQALYLQSLDCTQGRMAGVKAAVAAAPTGRAAVEAFFTSVMAACAHPDPGVNTCIVSSGLLEGIEDPAVSTSLRDKWRATETLLRSAIKTGQHDGSIRSDIAGAELARWLMVLTSGLRVSARAVDSAAQLKATVRLGLQVLWPPA